MHEFINILISAGLIIFSALIGIYLRKIIFKSLHAFADSGINFTVFLRAKEFSEQFIIKHEFIKALHKRYAQEGIVIPYPIRAINYSQEKAAKE